MDWWGRRWRCGSAWAAGAAVLIAGCSDELAVPGDDGLSRGLTASAPGTSAMDGGLLVAGEGQVTVPADNVRVVLFAGFDEFGVGTAISPREADEISDELAGLGINSDEIEISGSDPYAGASIRVQIAADELPDVAEEVQAAVEDVIGRVFASGLHMTVTDCIAHLGPAYDAAIVDVESAAERLAQSSGVQLGRLQGVTETDDPLTFFGADPCDPAAVGDGTGLAPLDAALDVELSVYVSANYTIGSPAPAAVTATGRGEASARADVATVVVMPDVDVDPFASTADREEDRQRVVDSLVASGVDKGAVRFVPLLYSGPGTAAIAVDVEADQLPSVGEEVVATIEDAGGPTGPSGVFFASSNCADLLREAQQKAVADAENRLREMARAAAVGLGDVATVVDLTGPGPAADLTSTAFAPPTARNPCDPEELIAVADPYGAGAALDRFDAEPRASVVAEILLGRGTG